MNVALFGGTFDPIHNGHIAVATAAADRFRLARVLFAPAALLENLYEPYMEALRFVRTCMDSYFFEQIALTLAVARHDIPVEILPLRYNYPNQAAFDARLLTGDDP